MTFPSVDPDYVLRPQDIPTEDWEYFSNANASIGIDTPLQQGDRVRVTTRDREIIDGTWLTVFVNYFEGVGITIRTPRGETSLQGRRVLAIKRLEDDDE